MAKWPVYDEMKWFVSPRQTGKTTKMIDWVLEGENTDSYPFNSRVIICKSIHEADHIRGMILDRIGKEEFDRRYAYNMVYHLSDWQRARIGAAPIEVSIDNADVILRGLVENPGIVLTQVTATGVVFDGVPTPDGPDVQG